MTSFLGKCILKSQTLRIVTFSEEQHCTGAERQLSTNGELCPLLFPLTATQMDSVVDCSPQRKWKVKLWPTEAAESESTNSCAVKEVHESSDCL